MSVISGALAASAAKKAARAQERAANEDRKVQQAMYEKTRADLAPYRDAGAGALPVFQDALGLNGATGYNNALAKFQTSPGYQFQLDQGTRAIENSSAAAGKLFSGQTGKALVGFGQGLANQEWGNWLGRVGGLTELGQNAAAQTGSLGLGYAGNISNAINNAGAAKASGYVGAANAWSNSLAGLGQIAGFAAGAGWLGKGAQDFAGKFYGVRP